MKEHGSSTIGVKNWITSERALVNVNEAIAKSTFCKKKSKGFNEFFRKDFYFSGILEKQIVWKTKNK